MLPCLRVEPQQPDAGIGGGALPAVGGMGLGALLLPSPYLALDLLDAARVWVP